MLDQERRQFNRVAFNTNATLMVNNTPCNCRLIDISLHGALVTLESTVRLFSDADYRLEIPLNGNSEKISMDLTLAHQDGLTLGLECLNIDLESITHLRRLIELNLGDSSLVDRDFQVLCSDNS